MKTIKFISMFIIVTGLLCGCNSPVVQTQNSCVMPPETSVEVPTNSISPNTSNTENINIIPKNNTSGETPNQTPSTNPSTDITKRDFSGTSLLSLPFVLNNIVQSKKPMTSFAALIMDVKKTNDYEYIFIIDKVELNNKNIDSGSNTEPPYFNKEIKKEQIAVSNNTVLILNNYVPMPVGDDFIKYVHDNMDENGIPEFVYNFYLCGNDVEFIDNVYIP